MPDIQAGLRDSHGGNGPLPTCTLLELFSLEPTPSAALEPSTAERRALWAADALHRANNLAQMSASLASFRVQHLHGLNHGDAVAGARSLSRAYAELGELELVSKVVPCTPLLRTIVAKLIELFGRERSISARIALEEVFLPAEQRRALILIVSELVINALKYAYPDKLAGEIVVTLARLPHKIELSVADDGVGLAAHSGGNGKALMERLAALLSAEIRRVSSRSGLEVTFSFPSVPE